MDRVPSNHRLAERRLITLVREGQWSIDERGRIWRSAMRTGLKTGGSHVIPVARRRVDRATPQGYLQVRAMLDGKRVCGSAATGSSLGQPTCGQHGEGEASAPREGARERLNQRVQEQKEAEYQARQEAARLARGEITPPAADLDGEREEKNDA
jgi:hypothetical protein